MQHIKYWEHFFYSKVDQYGFEREDDFDYETYERFMSEYLVVLTRRAVKWEKVVDPQHRTRKSIKGIPNLHPSVMHKCCFEQKMHHCYALNTE